MKVIVTSHAKERFVARFKFRFHKDVLHGRNLPIFMGDLFRKSIDADFHFRMNVGKYNQLCCKHGYRFRLKQYKDIVFCYSQETDDIVKITTAYRAV